MRNGVRVGGGKIRMMGDPRGQVTGALGMQMEMDLQYGGTR